MRYRIEIAEHRTDRWVVIGHAEVPQDEIHVYVCVIQRAHPGHEVRALCATTEQLVAIR